MHAPDGFLNAATAVTTGAVSLSVLTGTLRSIGNSLKERQAPLAGVIAAFIFAAQMFNFPVAAGTSGHLLGGALAAVLLGPALGSVVVTVVVVVQALVFADGGLTALGYNIINMAIVTAFGGYAAYWLLRKVLPANRGGVVGATGLAAGISVVLSATAFSLEWLFGATAPVTFDKVFGAMVASHVLIGVGEGVISALAVSAVLAVRPDLVYGAQDLSLSIEGRTGRVSRRVFVIAALVVTLAVAAVISQFAVDSPDGLERVAEDTGIVGEAGALEGSIFSDYAVAGLDNPTLSLAIAGIGGALVTLAVGSGLIVALRRRKDKQV
jgi:cobalt/nickel transport system permease protein